MVHATTATESLVVHVMLDSLAMELIAIMLTSVLKVLTTVMLMHLVSTALELLNVNAIMVTLETEVLATTLTSVLLTLTIVMLMLHAVMKSETCNSGFNGDGTYCEDVDEMFSWSCQLQCTFNLFKSHRLIFLHM